MKATLEIPKDELQYWELVQYRAEKEGDLLVGIVHQTELDWQRPDFKSVPLEEVLNAMH